jgi:FixJ family two-component response regulator
MSETRPEPPVLVIAGLEPVTGAQIASWANAAGWNAVVLTEERSILPAAIRLTNPDLVLVDWSIIADGSRAMTDLKLMMAAAPETQFAVLTGGAGMVAYQTAIEAMRVGARDFAEYPLQQAEITSLLGRAEQRFALPRRVATVENQIRAIRARLDSLHPSSAPSS